MTQTNELGRGVFKEACQQSMSFLVEDHGFRGPIAETPSPGLLKVAYLKGQVGVECVYEERDDDISVYLLKLHDGAKPVCFRRDEEGHVVRARLTELLIQKGIRGFDLQVVDAPVSELKAQQVLIKYADLIKKHLPDVLAGSADIFHAAT